MASKRSTDYSEDASKRSTEAAREFLDDIVYDSMDLHFNARRFIVQLAIHFSFPISYWFCPNVLVQGFCLRNLGYYVR